MANYGVIDMGSNTVRLVVYDVRSHRRKGQRPTPEDTSFHTIDNDKIMAGLASYVEGGYISQRGIDRAIDVLNQQLRFAEYYRCKRLDVFATAVIRNASNRDEALKAIEGACGCQVNLLSGKEEAHLGYVGASWDGNLGQDGALIDIGGGSSELTLFAADEEPLSTSIPQGSLSSFTRFTQNVLPTADEVEAIRHHIRKRIAKDQLACAAKAQDMYAIGGTVRACAKLVKQRYGLATRPQAVTRTEVEGLIDLCVNDVHGFVDIATKATAERIHTVIPGAVILDELMTQLGAEEIRICRHGLREGYLLERML